MVSSAESEGDAAAGQVVGRKLDLHAIAGVEADVVCAHLPRDRGEHAVTAIELHPEHRGGERFDDLAFNLDLLFLGRHLSSCKNRARTRGWLDGLPQRRTLLRRGRSSSQTLAPLSGGSPPLRNARRAVRG